MLWNILAVIIFIKKKEIKRIIGFLTYARQRLPDCFHFFSTNGRLLTQPLLNTILTLTDHVRVNCYDRLPPLDYNHPKVDLRDKTHFTSFANSNRGGNLHGLDAAKKIGKGPCANPFGQLVIMPPGTVVLCCSDGFKRIKLGDVCSHPIKEIWWGEPFHTIRRALANGNRKELTLCQECSVEGVGFYDYFIDPEKYQDIIEKFKQNEYNL